LFLNKEKFIMKKSLMAWLTVAALAVAMSPAFASTGQAPPGMYAQQNLAGLTKMHPMSVQQSGFGWQEGLGIPLLVKDRDSPFTAVKFNEDSGLAVHSSAKPPLGEPPGRIGGGSGDLQANGGGSGCISSTSLGEPPGSSSA
jgi:hypothetical protein